MDHLAEAKRLVQSAAGADITVEWAQVTATVAIAHVGIAMAERMDKATEDAELKAERREQYQEYQARRKMEIAL